MIKTGKDRVVNFQLWILILISVLSLVVISCGGGGGGGDNGGGGTVSIGATLDNSYSVAYVPTHWDDIKSAFLPGDVMALATGITVDQVVAIPTWQGNFGPGFLTSMKTARIGRDGSFTISLDRSYEWVLLLVDSTATNKRDKVAGYVAASVDDNNTLIAFSGSQLATDLSLGTLSSNNDEARSSTSGVENAASFDLSLEQLIALGKSDDSYKHLINLYLNYDPLTTKSYSIQPDFSWTFGAGSIAASTADVTGATISDYPQPGFGLTVETTYTQSFMLELCGTTTAMGLYLPESTSVTDGTSVWSGDTGFVNDGSGPSDQGFNNLGAANSAFWYDDANSKTYCYDDDFSVVLNDGAGGGLIGFGGRDALLQVPADGFPAGMWELKIDDITVAEFDLEIGAPTNTSGKIDAIPVPALKVNTVPATGEITELEIRWFQYDPTSDQYTELTASERAAFEDSYLVRDTFIEIQDEDGASGLSTPINGLIRFFEGDPPGYPNELVTRVDMASGTHIWYLPGSDGDTNNLVVPTNIRVGMHMGGALYSFGWH